jgi:DNA-binding CsgD family transcriptional regulator
MPALLRSVRQFVGADSAGFFWVDARGDMTNLYAERLLSEDAMRLYFENYYISGESCFRHAFIERARAPEPVMAVSPSPALERSVFRALDAHHVLYGIVRAQGHALGQLSLYRPKSAPGFSATQRSELSSIMHYVAHGVSQRGRISAAAQTFLDTNDDAVFLIGHRGDIRQCSSRAHKLLTLATHGSLGRERIEYPTEDKAKPILQRLTEQLRQALTDDDVGPPCIALSTAWGRFVLRAYSMADVPQADDATVAVRIQRQEPTLLKFVDALGAQGLTPKQREVALGLAKGSSNREIAEVMGVSINTVAYHVKELFVRLDAHDRQEMIGKILADAGQPR